MQDDEFADWRDDSFQRAMFVYDIRVDESQRGKGYGRAAMVFAEEEARRRGHDRVALNVFGGERGRAEPLPLARL
jgi:GNAT superfamily N-acetyltransferase